MSETANPADSHLVAECRWLEATLKGRPVPPVLAVIGLGQGHLLDALDRCAPATRVLALEPNPERAATFLARRSAHEWRASGRLVYLTGPDYEGADQAWRIFPPGVVDPTIAVGRTHVVTERDVHAARVLKKIVFGVRANDEARRQFAPRYLVNSLRNVPAIVAGSDVRGLSGAYRGIPGVIAAAGPSLDLVVEELRDSADRALLIAADTALRPLLIAGAAPSLVVALDPSAVNARHLLSLPECRDAWLVSESALDRDATAVFEERTFWFHASNHHPWPWLNECGLDVGGLEVWGSVLTGAFDLACLAGCDPIVIVGADLSYTGDRPYARGTTYELEWARVVATGGTLDEIWRTYAAQDNVRRIADLRGIETATTPALLAFRDWMLARARRSGRRVINATGAGMLFGQGVEQARLSEALHRTCTMPPVSAFARRFTGIRPSTVATRLREVRRRLDQDPPAAPPLAQWAEFSGSGFDPIAVGAALDEAARALETTTRGPVKRTIAWSQLDGSGAIDRIFTRLPETAARFRAALNGVPLPPGLETVPGENPTDRAALLVHARNLFDHICDAVLHGEDLSPNHDATRCGMPISAMYAWPETTRWAVQLFEALLANAWAPTVPPPASLFFTRPAWLRNDASDAPVLLPHATHACMVLALQWQRCQAGLREDVAASEAFTAIVLPDALCQPALARMLTGTLDCRDTRRDDAIAPEPRGTRVDRTLPTWPRVLVEEGSGPIVAYATSEGAVCVTPHAHESVVMGPDGSIRPHHAWPHPILNELPFGDGGAVAWGTGPSHHDPCYVMYRHRPGDDVRVQELAIRPVNGAWWQGRLYWSCFSWIESWIGVSSWAPGEEPRIELPGLTLHAVNPDDAGLRLEPCVYRPGIGYERRLLLEGWRWRGGESLEPLALGPSGAASSFHTNGRWTATAYPEADLVRLESNDGRACSMTCFHPMRLAWIGDSLLVSTAQRALLLFERLAERLDACTCRR